MRVISGGSDSAPTDDGLVRAFLAGDSSAFGTLIKRHQDSVYKVARRFARSPEDARDLSQRVFLQAFEVAQKTLSRLEAQEVPFRAWVLRVALNMGMNHVRDGSKWKLASVDSLDRSMEPRALNAAEQLERAEQEALTRQAVLALPERQREVFLLRIDAGLSFAEVGNTLDISESNAKSNFHHAVKKLKEEVARLSGASGGAS
ncbi:MAG: sigma-70 family RNA polymerase sigma factor [Archangium sp.]|nr:sigma-70 family RNA polymerase sigma factor [Archangium sp.]